MRRVQKAAAVLAALALTTALAVPVWADDITSVDNPWKVTGANDVFVSESKDIPIKATYDMKKQYRVDLSWTDMSFTYTTGSWDTSDTGNTSLTYSSATGWNNNNGSATTETAKATHTISIINYSNADMAVKLEYTNDDTENDIVNENGRKRVGCFFIPNDVEGLTTSNYADYLITAGSSIWLQRADANVTGMVPEELQGTGTKAKNDTAGLNARGTAVKAEIGVMMAGRPKKAYQDEQIGKLTITLSDAGENLKAPTAPGSENYARAFTQDNMTTGGAKVS